MACLQSKLKTLSSFLTLFIFFVISVLPNNSYSDTIPREYKPKPDNPDSGKTGGNIETDYMVKLMNALTPTPVNWSTNTDVCQWSGVSCDSGYVDRIELRYMSLTGTLPSGLNESLSHLTKLDLSMNSLSGALPSLANLNKLHEVHLDGNNFTSIPDGCFQGLIGLQTLSLSDNVNLAPWKFPTDLTSSSALNALQLDATNLRGSLPEIFDSFPNLNTVDLSNNSLNGVLPKSFAQSNIQMLYLSYQNHDKLSGTIEILSSMTNLEEVRLQGNHFEGPIPDLSNCTQLRYLELEDNLLTGVVPLHLMNLSTLEIVSLDHNFLQGPLPSANFVVRLGVGDNTSNSFCLDHAGPCDQRVTTLLEIAAGFGYPLLLARSWRGNNPCRGWSFISCDGSKIRTMNLTKLNLTGTISLAFSNLTDLRHLYLGDNNLWGSIPESLATLPQLEVVDVSNNNLSGNIPKFSHMVRFNITGNVLLSQANGTSPSSVSRDRPSSTKASLSTRWIAGAASIGAGVIAIFVVVIYNRKRCLSFVQKMVFKNTGTFTDQIVEDFIKTYGSLAPKQYSYSEVQRMTNSLQDKLGQGGYGAVYKASLMDGRQVAVKILSESKGSGEEFINEVASISRTSHVNIVSLLGFCYEKNKRALIYEFMSNGSLDKFIYNKGSLNVICNLDWNTLFQITIGIARGLEYLHRGCNTRILHLDIKPQNILLDEHFCPKIADFGLAKICKMKESVVSIPGPRGTPGYIAPEIFSRTYGGVSHKSDVYSYGMLILEVVGGRNNYDTGGSQSSEMYFPDWIYKDLEQGNIPARCLAHTEEESDMVMKITLVSLWCIQPNPSDRPSMNKVVEMLEGSLQSIPYPPKPVLYSLERPPLQYSNISHSSTHETISITP